ncbi:MAG: hydroxymethylbilane synthase, partial [bacterium]
AVGQGTIAVEMRANDENAHLFVAELHDEATWCEVNAERALMRTLEGGCQIPIGALARCLNGKLVLDACIASLDGEDLFRASIEGSVDEAEDLGIRLAHRLLDMGGKKILEEIRSGL